MADKLQPTWKKVIVISVTIGASFAITLALIIGMYVWYESYPKPPTPWNKEAITANYDLVDTEGADNTILFYYTLENKTKYDYTIEKETGLTILARLKEQGSLSGTKGEDKWLHVDYPVFIPSGQRLRFAVHLKYPYEQKEKIKPTKEEHQQYRKGLEEFINKEFTNLDGFVLFDEKNRYEIMLPKGW